MASVEDMTPPELLAEAKQTILDLIEDINEIIDFDDGEQGEFVLIKLFFTRLNEETIMKQIIQNILPHKKQITKRTEKFFLEHETLFSSLPGDRTQHYREVLIDDDRLDEDDRSIVWDYFDTLIWIGEEYKKKI